MLHARRPVCIAHGLLLAPLWSRHRYSHFTHQESLRLICQLCVRAKICTQLSDSFHGSPFCAIESDQYTEMRKGLLIRVGRQESPIVYRDWSSWVVALARAVQLEVVTLPPWASLSSSAYQGGWTDHLKDTFQFWPRCASDFRKF